MEILNDLNPAQQEAVTFDGGPLLILAGAGSGKTRVLTYRVAYLIGSGKASAENMLLLTFTNKAAGEMMKRVKALLHQDFVGHSGTFHSFCAKVLRKYAIESGIDENFVIFDADDQIDTIKQAMSKLGVDPKNTKPGAVLGLISQAKNELIGPQEYVGYARGTFQKTTAAVYLTYQQLLSKYKALDFDDLLMKTVDLLRQNKDVRESLQAKYRYVLVDEYQDTNKAQYTITKILSQTHKNLTAVGDAAQAIYSWRGADYRNLLLLSQDFLDLKTLNLEQNYRSTQNILGAANEVIGKNKNHPILKLWTDKGSGEKITIFEAESETDEAMFVVNKIYGNKYADIAVLYRTNAQSRVLEESLLHMGIPYSLVGGTRFYERKEIKDVLAYLRLIINPGDEVARKRAEKNGKQRLAKLENSQLETNDRLSLELLDQVLRITGYLDQYDPENEEDAARIENIKELRSVAEEFPNLMLFLENVTLTETESRKNNQNGVILTTIHAAKGLEFKTVFMVGMEEGLFPHSRSLMDPTQMEEERRLCYVGMTRAMDKLYMTYAKRRLYFGTRNNNLVSRFLGDVPEELIDSPTSSRKAGLRGAIVKDNWGFDESGEWKWNPDE